MRPCPNPSPTRPDATRLRVTDRYSRLVLGELVDIVDERRRFVRPPGRPFVVGVTGSVAVGKSHLALDMAGAVEGLGGSPTASLLETDAFLRPNRDLDEAGLTMRKGFPETFDADALVTALQQLRQGRGAVVPVYSHVTYDITPDQTREVPARDLVILAGLHLGLFARAEIDLLIQLEAAEDDLETWYLERFRALYREAVDDPTSFYRSMVPLGEEGALAIGEQAWTTINLVNLREHIDPARALADVVVLKGSDHGIVAITRQSGSWMKGW
jgi:type I pantothenate kinase